MPGIQLAKPRSTCALPRARSPAGGSPAGATARKPRSKWPASGEIPASKRHVQASIGGGNRTGRSITRRLPHRKGKTGVASLGGFGEASSRASGTWSASGTPQCRGRGMSGGWSSQQGRPSCPPGPWVGVLAARHRIRRESKSVAGQRESEPGIVPVDPPDSTTGGEGRLGTSVVLDAEPRMRAWLTPITP